MIADFPRWLRRIVMILFIPFAIIFLILTAIVQIVFAMIASVIEETEEIINFFKNDDFVEVIKKTWRKK